MYAVVAAIHRPRRQETEVGVKIRDLVLKEHLQFSGHSGDEAVLLGWIRGVQVAQEMGADEVIVAVNRQVLEGHLRLGWKVRSLAMLAAWKTFAMEVQGLKHSFTYKTGHTSVVKLDRHGLG